jgi:hypothetical protein
VAVTAARALQKQHPVPNGSPGRLVPARGTAPGHAGAGPRCCSPQGLHPASGRPSGDRSAQRRPGRACDIAHAGHPVIQEIAAMLPVDGDARDDAHQRRDHSRPGGM